MKLKGGNCVLVKEYGIAGNGVGEWDTCLRPAAHCLQLFVKVDPLLRIVGYFFVLHALQQIQLRVPLLLLSIANAE